MLQEPNDGVITVESTKLEGMTDWVVVSHAHTFIMNSRLVAELCVSFIKDGKFNYENASNHDFVIDVNANDTANTDKIPGE